MQRLLILSIFLFCSSLACAGGDDLSSSLKQPAAKRLQTVSVAPKLLENPIEPVLLELPTYALPYWRDTAQTQKPTLVLMSLHPFLQPINPALKTEVAALMKSGNLREFISRGSNYRSNPAVIPQQTLSAALEADLFTEVIWVFPFSEEIEKVDPDSFRRQAMETGFFSAEEGGDLNWDGSQFTGRVRGTPLRIVHPQKLPSMDSNFLLHVDLGYFKGLYHNEVKTPIYAIIRDTAWAMAVADWAPQQVTLSWSTIEGSISTDVRFLLSDFAELLRNPELLNKMPKSWLMRSQAMQAASFFREGKAREIYERSATLHPEDAAVQYDLYLQLLTPSRIDVALAQLDKAVALDPGYAAVYLDLAQVAQQENNLAGLLDLLGRAVPAFPENPFIDLHRAQYLIQAGLGDTAKPLITRLKSLSWSPYFHAEVPRLLTEMEAQLNNFKP